jgi:lipoprotein-releasing system permease protein
MNKLAFFIALRYARSKRKLNFITIISLLSTLGISIGVAALIIVLSVFNGFSSLVTTFLISLDPHVRVEASSEAGMQGLEQILPKLKTVNGLNSFTPYTSGKLVLRVSGDVRVVNARAASAQGVTEVYQVDKYLIDGEIYKDTGSVPGVLIGKALADYLGVVPGDQLTLVSTANIEAVIGQGALPLLTKAVVSGIYYSKNNDYDLAGIFLPYDEGSHLLGFDGPQGYDLRLADESLAKAAKEQIGAMLPANQYSVKTWFDLHGDLFTVMIMERWAAYLLLSLIILVAVFNILASLTMTVIEKKRNIGIMRAMGMPPQLIRRIYLFHGLIIGVAGTFGGFLLGVFVYWLQITYVIYPLDPVKFKIAALPIELQTADFFVVGFAAIALSLLAALLPAKRAANIDALEAIRWE